MNSKRMFFAMLGGIVVLVGLCAAGTYFANNMIISEGKKLNELKLEDAVGDKKIANLQQAKKDIAKYEELEMIAKSVVPQDKDQANTVIELVNMAKESGITITAIEFPESQLGMVTKGKKSTSAKNAPTVDSKTTQLTPLESPKGVYSMEIQVQTDQEDPIRYSQLLNYLKKLENNRRTAQVSNISITPEEGNRQMVTFTLTLNSFVKP